MQTITPNHIRALFKLLETESGSTRVVLKQALASAIQLNPQGVEQVLAEDFPQQAPREVIHTLEEICWEDLSISLANFASKINPDLEEGLSLLAKFSSPTTARGKITGPLDALAAELRPALINSKNCREAAREISRFIFEIQQFKLVPAARSVKELSFPYFLRKKQGSALCLACLYFALGQRYGMDIEIADLAGRIVLFVQDKTHNDSFFIDPLDNGKLITQDECSAYLQARDLSKEKDLTILSSRLIVRRFLANMIFILNRLRDGRRLTYVRNYLEILKN